MNTVQLIANVPHFYDKDLKAGESYECRAEHAPLLVRVGTSRLAESKDDETEAKGKGKYQRRDLRAEK